MRNNSRTILIEREIYFIYDLSVNIHVGIDSIKVKDIFIYYKRDTIIIGLYNSIEVQVNIISKSEKI